MSIQVRPGYSNPLATRANTKQNVLNFGRRGTADQTADLQAKQQQLQNTLLLLKSTGTNSGVSTAEQQEQLQAALEQVSDELRAAKNDVVQKAASISEETVQEQADAASSAAKPRMDMYEKRTRETASPGIYQVMREESSGYRIFFSPYAE